MLNGYCELTSKEGKIYFGNAKNDKKEGFGIYYTPKPSKFFIGFWKNNKQEGVGKLITEKFSKYGFWNQGERLNWFDTYSEAISQLGTNQLNYEKSYQMELKNVQKLINKISII